MEKSFLLHSTNNKESTIPSTTHTPDGIAFCRLCCLLFLPKTRNLHLGIEFLGISFNAYPNKNTWTWVGPELWSPRARAIGAGGGKRPRSGGGGSLLFGYLRIYGKSKGGISRTNLKVQALINRKVRLLCHKVLSRGINKF